MRLVYVMAGATIRHKNFGRIDYGSYQNVTGAGCCNNSSLHRPNVTTKRTQWASSGSNPCGAMRPSWMADDMCSKAIGAFARHAQPPIGRAPVLPSTASHVRAVFGNLTDPTSAAQYGTPIGLHVEAAMENTSRVRRAAPAPLVLPTS